MAATVHEIARGYRSAGLSVMPVLADGSKSPALREWNPLRDRLATEEEIAEWFGSGELVGVAVICGKVSGGLTVLDFDSPDAWRKWQDLPPVKASLGAWLSLPRVRTPAGGVHLYVRRGLPPGNKKLAKDEAGKTLVEIKAEGGYVLAPGCPPECHPSHGTYAWEVCLPGLEHLFR